MVSHRQYGRTARAWGWFDLLALAALVTLVGGVVMVAREWSGPLRPVAEIHLEPAYLPLYTIFSLARGLVAYGVSFAFTLVYGYAMARVAGAERILLPLLDVLQSIPVLGFLPGFVLALVHLFPRSNFGLELASVLMIFTGQVWNMTFSFYSSLKTTPADLQAVSRIAGLSWWERFLRLDLSFAANGLVWNSMMSMAGGWFFLTVSEAFVLGEHDFRLPGLGSYMSLAIERGDATAQILGVLSMLAMIIAMDQILWRPIVAWSHKFTDEERTGDHTSWLWERLRRSRLARAGARSLGFVGRARWSRTASTAGPVGSPPDPHARQRQERRRRLRRQTGRALLSLALGTLLLVGVAKYFELLATLKPGEWLQLLRSAGATLLRVLLAVLLASLWAVPVGVWIGRHPAWARRMQPLIQMAASFPAPMVFPVVVGGLLLAGVDLSVSSVVLLMLGTQWYVLFNVIAGSAAIPRELWELTALVRLRPGQRWRALILPALFPHLLTGWITAMGGAWNASIVAEYMKYQGRTLSTTGLGSAINHATEQGNFHLLAAAVGLMALAVVGINRLLWRPLSRSAQTRYSFASS